MTGDNHAFEEETSAAIYDNFNRWSAGDDFYLGLARDLDKGMHHVGHSRIRFIDQPHVAGLLVQADLEALAWYGSWDRSPFLPTSREIIVVTRRAG